MLIPGLSSGNPAVRARSAANAGFISPNPTPSFGGTGLGGSGQAGATNTGSYGGTQYYGGFTDPFAGDIFKGLPTTVGQTPWGSPLASARAQLQTPQQLRTTASQQAMSGINAQLGANAANYTAQLQYLTDMQNRSAGLAQALGDFGPGYASAIQ